MWISLAGEDAQFPPSGLSMSFYMWVEKRWTLSIMTKYLDEWNEMKWKSYFYRGDILCDSVQFSRSVLSDSATPWITARRASLFITNSRSSLRLMSIESVMPSSHLILCRPLLLLPPIPPSIRVLSNESTVHTIDAEKAFDKIQHPFMIKKPSRKQE